MHRAKKTRESPSSLTDTETNGFVDEESQHLISSPSSLRSRSNSDADIVGRSLSPFAISDVRGGVAAPIITPQEKLKIGFYFGLWYALNVVYNSEFVCHCYLYYY